MIRSPILFVATMLIFSAFLDGSHDVLADGRINLRCNISGESITHPFEGRRTKADDSEILWFEDAPFGMWADTVDLEVEPNSRKVVMKWNGRTIPAHRPYRFRPNSIFGKVSEPDVKRQWRFRFRSFDISSHFNIVESAVDASRVSTKTGQADVTFHGSGYCSVYRMCGTDSIPDNYSDEDFCFDRANRCYVLRRN